MKISIVDGEKQGIKYITAGSEKIVVVENFSRSCPFEEDNDQKEKSYHNLEWKTTATLEKILSVMKKLDTEAQYDYDKEERGIDEGEEPRGIAVGRKFREGHRLHPQPDFWQHAYPLSQLQDEDLSLSLIAPHYKLHCHNISYKNEDQGLPLRIDEVTVEKNLNRKPVREGVNRIEVIAYFNISSTLAYLVTATSPFFTSFTEDKTMKAILTHKFDQLLSTYQKPTKFN